MSQKGVGAHGVNVGARHTFEQLPCTRKWDKGPGRKGQQGRGKREQEQAGLIQHPLQAGRPALPPGEWGFWKGRLQRSRQPLAYLRSSSGLLVVFDRSSNRNKAWGKRMTAALMEHSWAIVMSPMLPFHRWENGSFVIYLEPHNCRTSPAAQRLPVMRETWVRPLGREDPLEKEMATHCSVLAWKIPWVEESGGLQATAFRRVRRDWATERLHFHTVAKQPSWDLSWRPGIAEPTLSHPRWSRRWTRSKVKAARREVYFLCSEKPQPSWGPPAAPISCPPAGSWTHSIPGSKTEMTRPGWARKFPR